jgi:hypothetical protein
MKEIIEKQKIKAFLNKLSILWAAEISFVDFISEEEINIYLNQGIRTDDLSLLLVPKIYMFVDFETPITLNFIDTKRNIYALDNIHKNSSKKN